MAGVPFQQRRVGRYLLTALLGEGGMGAAYRGRLEGAEGFAREFVLKCQLPAARKHLKYFIAEAKIGACLHHENIVSVSEFFEAEGALWLVMEYIRGVDLAKLLRVHSRLPMRVAVYIVRAISLGLHHAHEAKGEDGRPLGIVHRDMSPDNVLISLDGVVKITDFGVARADGMRTATEAPSRKLIGKFSYMDPVMLKGEPVDRRADVYAVSVILWELLASRPAFPPMSSVQAMAVKVMTGDVAQLRAVAPGLPEPLYSLVQHGMATDQEQRISTCEWLADAIERVFPEWSTARALRETQRELARLVEEAAKAPSEPKDDDDDEPAALPDPAPAAKAPDPPPPAPAAVAPSPPSASPWTTTLRPTPQNAADLDRMAVPHEIHDDKQYTKIVSEPHPATPRPWPTDRTPLLDPNDVDNARVRRASRPTVPSSRPTPAARPRRTGRIAMLAVCIAILLASAGVVAAMLLRHDSSSVNTFNPPSAAPVAKAQPGPPSASDNTRTSPPPPAAPPVVAVATLPAPSKRERDPQAAAKLLQQARTEFSDERYRQAIKDATASIRLGGGAEAYEMRAAGYLRMGKPDEAARDFRAVLQIDPTNKNAGAGLQAALQAGRSGKVIIEGPATNCTIDGERVGNTAPVEVELPPGEHAYAVDLNVDVTSPGEAKPVRRYKSTVTVVVNKTTHVTPALDALLSDAEASRRAGRTYLAREQAKQAIEIATKLHERAKESAAWAIVGLAGCQDHRSDIASNILSMITSAKDRESVESACKTAGVQLR